MPWRHSNRSAFSVSKSIDDDGQRNLLHLSKCRHTEQEDAYDPWKKHKLPMEIDFNSALDHVNS